MPPSPTASSAASTVRRAVAEKSPPEAEVLRHRQRRLHGVLVAEIMAGRRDRRPCLAAAFQPRPRRAAGSSPATMRSSVDLPDPFGPVTTSASPVPRAKATPEKTVSPPRSPLRLFGDQPHRAPRPASQPPRLRSAAKMAIRRVWNYSRNSLYPEQPPQRSARQPFWPRPASAPASRRGRSGADSGNGRTRTFARDRMPSAFVPFRQNRPGWDRTCPNLSTASIAAGRSPSGGAEYVYYSLDRGREERARRASPSFPIR